MNERPWYLPRSPDQIEPIPWIHPSAIEYLDSILQPEWAVLEHGGGGSTLWLAERVCRVTTIEHSPEWRQKLIELAPPNVTIIKNLPPTPSMHDLFFIDGKRDERGICILRAPLYVLPGGWIVLDNANRPEYARERKSLFKIAELVKRFDNNIPYSKYFVTEFWLCHASD